MTQHAGGIMAVRKPIAALELQPSESVVVHAASRIFSSLIASGRLTEASRQDLIAFSARTAIDLALEIDRILVSDDEGRAERGPLGPLG